MSDKRDDPPPPTERTIIRPARPVPPGAGAAPPPGFPPPSSSVPSSSVPPQSGAGGERTMAAPGNVAPMPPGVQGYAPAAQAPYGSQAQRQPQSGPARLDFAEIGRAHV